MADGSPPHKRNRLAGMPPGMQDGPEGEVPPEASSPEPQFSPDEAESPQSSVVTEGVKSVQELARKCIKFSDAFGYTGLDEPHTKLELFTDTWMKTDANRFRSGGVSTGLHVPVASFFRRIQCMTDTAARIGRGYNLDTVTSDELAYIVDPVFLRCEEWLDDWLLLDGVVRARRFDDLQDVFDEDLLRWEHVTLDSSGFFCNQIYTKGFTLEPNFDGNENDISENNPAAQAEWTKIMLSGLKQVEAAFVPVGDLKSPRTFMKEDLADDLEASCTALAEMLAQARHTVGVLNLRGSEYENNNDINSAKYIVIMCMLAQSLLNAYKMWITDDADGGGGGAAGAAFSQYLV